MRTHQFCLVALLVVIPGIASVAASLSAQAQGVRINEGCPPIDQMPAGITADELVRLCYGDDGALTCGQIRGLTRIRAEEGQTAVAQFNLACSDRPSNYVPPPQLPQGLSGRYEYSRGYTKLNPNVSPVTCQTRYGTAVGEPPAEVRNGRISFRSGGHLWTGVVTDNNWILVGRDDVTPKPLTATAVMGPITNATLVNGHCGSGFFRLGRRL